MKKKEVLSDAAYSVYLSLSLPFHHQGELTATNKRFHKWNETITITAMKLPWELCWENKSGVGSSSGLMCFFLYAMTATPSLCLFSRLHLHRSLAMAAKHHTKRYNPSFLGPARVEVMTTRNQNTWATQSANS